MAPKSTLVPSSPSPVRRPNGSVSAAAATVTDDERVGYSDAGAARGSAMHRRGGKASASDGAGPMMRAALYARYSSNKQNEASCEDQLRECERAAQHRGCTVVKRYANHATSCASMLGRSGIQELMRDGSRLPAKTPGTS